MDSRHPMHSSLVKKIGGWAIASALAAAAVVAPAHAGINWKEKAGSKLNLLLISHPVRRFSEAASARVHRLNRHRGDV